MANPTTIDRELCVLLAATIEQSVDLNSAREYTVANLANAEDGSQALTQVYLGTSPGAVLDGAAGADKFVLAPNRVVVVGPGVAALRFRAQSGTTTLGVAPAPYDRMTGRG